MRCIIDTIPGVRVISLNLDSEFFLAMGETRTEITEAKFLSVFSVRPSVAGIAVTKQPTAHWRLPTDSW